MFASLNASRIAGEFGVKWGHMFRLTSFLFGFLALFAVGFSTASANQGELVSCDYCKTEGQFKTAAVAKTPNIQGDYQFKVGNVSTGEFFFVNVQVRKQGVMPHSTNDVLSDKSASENNSSSEGLGEFGAVRPSGPGATLYSIRVSEPSAQQKRDFQTLIRLANLKVIVDSPTDKYGFDSFRGSEPVAVGNYLYNQMTEKTQGRWATSLVAKGFGNLLKFSYKMTNGKGPKACLIFRNGDSACFQLNPTAPSAPRYIKGSAKDVNGDPIGDESSGYTPIGSGSEGNSGIPVRPSSGQIFYGKPAAYVCGWVFVNGTGTLYCSSR